MYAETTTRVIRSGSPACFFDKPDQRSVEVIATMTHTIIVHVDYNPATLRVLSPSLTEVLSFDLGAPIGSIARMGGCVYAAERHGGKIHRVGSDLELTTSDEVTDNARLYSGFGRLAVCGPASISVYKPADPSLFMGKEVYTVPVVKAYNVCFCPRGTMFVASHPSSPGLIVSRYSATGTLLSTIKVPTHVQRLVPTKTGVIVAMKKSSSSGVFLSRYA
jgi:hypothetical protein